MKRTLVLSIVAFVLVSCNALKSVFNKAQEKKGYSAAFILQADYENNTKELVNIQKLVGSLVENEIDNLSNIFFFRSDNEKIKEFTNNTIDFTHSIFNEKNEYGSSCDNSNLQSWISCCLGSYPLLRSNDEIIVYSSEGKGSGEIIDNNGISHQVYYEINVLKDTLSKLKKHKESYPNLMIFHYQQSLTFCDTIETYLKNQEERLAPVIIEPKKDHTVRQSSFNKYEFRWKLLNGMEKYEIVIQDNRTNQMTFNVDVEDCLIAEDGKSLIYRLAEDEIRDSIMVWTSPDQDSELDHVADSLERNALDSLFQKSWQLMVRGRACGEHYTPYSAKTENIMFRCQ